ncbi:MAG: hypothetical protein ACE5G9_13600 [Nitrospinales bacterium]
MKRQPGTRIIFFAILFFFFSVPNIFGAVQSPLVDADSNLGVDVSPHSPTSENTTILEHSNKAEDPILLADKKKTGGGERIEKGENGDDDDEGKEKEDDDEGKEKEDDENENEDKGGKSKDDDKGKGHDDD